MATPTFIPVAGVADITEVVSANAQTEINGEIDKIIALIPDTNHPTAQNTAQTGGKVPEYDRWPPSLASQMRAELADLKVHIDAAPTA